MNIANKLVFVFVYFIALQGVFGQESDLSKEFFLMKIQSALLKNQPDSILKYASDRVRSDSTELKRNVEWVHNYLEGTGFGKDNIHNFNYYFGGSSSNRYSSNSFSGDSGVITEKQSYIFKNEYLKEARDKIGHSLALEIKKRGKTGAWTITAFDFADNYWDENFSINAFVADFPGRECDNQWLHCSVHFGENEFAFLAEDRTEKKLNFDGLFRDLRYKRLSEVDAETAEGTLVVMQLRKDDKTRNENNSLIVAFYNSNNTLLISDGDKYAFYEVNRKSSTAWKEMVKKLFSITL